MLMNCGVGEDSWESLGLQEDQISQSWKKSVLNIHCKDWCWNWSSNTLATCKKKSQLIGKDSDTRKDLKQEKGMKEDEIFGWHHWLNRPEFEQTLGDSKGQGSLVCCSLWGGKESDTTWRLNSNNLPFEWPTKENSRPNILEMLVLIQWKIKLKQSKLCILICSPTSIKTKQ